jgi:hypothetical protein
LLAEVVGTDVRDHRDVVRHHAHAAQQQSAAGGLEHCALHTRRLEHSARTGRPAVVARSISSPCTSTPSVLDQPVRRPAVMAR